MTNSYICIIAYCKHVEFAQLTNGFGNKSTENKNNAPFHWK